MILTKFKTGWQNAFEHKIQYLFDLFPDLKVESILRTHGLLRIKLKAPLDKSVQYVVDCVTFKIERESATTCEVCGEYGIRRDAHLPDKMCLCWKCYALELDELANRNELSLSK